MVEHRPSIVSVLERYVPLRKSGRSFVGRCPFHDDQHPSFNVSEEKGVFHCFGCGASGDVITFIQRMEGIDFKQAINKLNITAEYKPKRIDTRRRSAAARLANWLDEQHLKVGALLRELSQQIGIAERIPDIELVESLNREWEILSDLYADLQRPEYAQEFLEAKDSIETITALAPIEPLLEFPELTPRYLDYLAAAVKGELC
jgi:DNA primase